MSCCKFPHLMKEGANIPVPELSIRSAIEFDFKLITKHQKSMTCDVQSVKWYYKNCWLILHIVFPLTYSFRRMRCKFLQHSSYFMLQVRTAYITCVSAFKSGTTQNMAYSICKTLWQFAPLSDISQGSVATDLRCGEIFSMVLLQIFSWFWQWNNFDKRLCYDRGTARRACQ